MTTTVNLLTIAESIAGLDLSANGINTKTPAEIPVSGMTQCPYFAPRPDNFITGIVFSREALGTGGAEPMNLSYTMNWHYYHSPIGTVLMFQDYSDMLSNIAYILETIADNDAPSGAVDIQINDIPTIAQVADPAGNYFHGAVISIRVLEFIK